MRTIFLDLCDREDFVASALADSINIPLQEFLSNEVGILKLFPRSTRIEYYYPLGDLEDKVIRILNGNGFRNIHNRGNIIAKPIIHEYGVRSKIQYMEREKENTRFLHRAISF